MKSIVLATAFSLAASSVFAGGLTEPVVEPVVETVQSESGSSNNGIFVLALAAVLLAAVTQ